MPPKREIDVFDGGAGPTTDNADAPTSVVGSTRTSKRKRTQVGKSVEVEQSVEQTVEQTPGEDVENIAPPGAPVTPRRSGVVNVLKDHNAASVTSPEDDENTVVGGTRTQPDASPTPAGSGTTSAEYPPIVGAAVLDYRPLSWYPVNLDRRLRALLAYKKPADGIYSLSLFPDREAAWGQSDTSSNKLCLRGASVPVVLWIVGSVTSVWFYDQNGNPHNKVSMGVAPLTADAMTKGRCILSQFARPPQNIESWNTHISASRWQTMRIPKRRDVAVIPFDRCYNATTRFESKSKMPTLPIEDIKVNDLVLMEVNVGRYSTSKDSNNAGGPSRFQQGKDKFKPRTSFAEWKPTFDLLSVSLLCAAPDDPVEAAMEDAPDADISI